VQNSFVGDTQRIPAGQYFRVGQPAGIRYTDKADAGYGDQARVIGGTDMDSPELVTTAGRSAEGAIVATVFNPETQDRETREFVRRFLTKYGVVPDTWAAQGYDALSVLAAAIRKANSTVPIVVASTLRFIDDWRGVTGSYVFTKEGDVQGKTVFFKIVKDGKFEFMYREKAGEEVNPAYVREDTTLRIPIEGSVSTIDPGQTVEMGSIEITAQLFLGLTNFDPKTYQPVPELATGWTVSDDGKSYRFRLRDDVKWTDGSQVTAHDIVWAIHRNLNPDTKSPYVSSLYVLKNAEAVNKGKSSDYSQIGVNAPDDFTIEFTLEHPATHFPALTGLWMYRPLHRKAIEDHKEKWTEPKNIQSNGPYKLAYWNKAQVMILRKNPAYYDAKNVRIEEVRYYNIPQGSVGLEMYRNNELDILGGIYLKIPFAEILNLRTDPRFRREYSQTAAVCLDLLT
ncbi:MAG: ABC transporter substrate-binding protein, partial [Desulfobacteraceae bacterium]|nr:ABC transporter substrate-binding protein [Desulfobacteraceae bacterium]